MTGGERNSQELHETTEIFREIGGGGGVSGFWEIAKRGDLTKPVKHAKMGIIGNRLYLTGGLAKDGKSSTGEKRPIDGRLNSKIL